MDLFYPWVCPSLVHPLSLVSIDTVPAVLWTAFMLHVSPFQLTSSCLNLFSYWGKPYGCSLFSYSLIASETLTYDACSWHILLNGRSWLFLFFALFCFALLCFLFFSPFPFGLGIGGVALILLCSSDWPWTMQPKLASDSWHSSCLNLPLLGLKMWSYRSYTWLPNTFFSQCFPSFTSDVEKCHGEHVQV